TAIARAIAPQSRRRVAFWLFLALLLAVAALIHLGHTLTASVMAQDGGYTLVSADEHADGDCASHGGALGGSHCCPLSGCVVAVLSVPSAASPFSAEAAHVTMNNAAVPGRLPSPFFHPPKLIVQA